MTGKGGQRCIKGADFLDPVQATGVPAKSDCGLVVPADAYGEATGDALGSLGNDFAR